MSEGMLRDGENRGKGGRVGGGDRRHGAGARSEGGVGGWRSEGGVYHTDKTRV